MGGQLQEQTADSVSASLGVWDGCHCHRRTAATKRQQGCLAPCDRRPQRSAGVAAARTREGKGRRCVAPRAVVARRNYESERRASRSGLKSLVCRNRSQEVRNSLVCMNRSLEKYRKKIQEIYRKRYRKFTEEKKTTHTSWKLFVQCSTWLQLVSN